MTQTFEVTIRLVTDVTTTVTADDVTDAIRCATVEANEYLGVWWDGAGANEHRLSQDVIQIKNLSVWDDTEGGD